MIQPTDGGKVCTADNRALSSFAKMYSLPTCMVVIDVIPQLDLYNISVWHYVTSVEEIHVLQLKLESHSNDESVAILINGTIDTANYYNKIIFPILLHVHSLISLTRSNYGSLILGYVLAYSITGVSSFQLQNFFAA